MLSPENEQSPLSEQIIGSMIVVRFARPSLRNTLSSETLDALADTVQRIKSTTSLHAAILTGLGDAFASGADIRELATLTSSTARAFSQRGQQITREIANLNQVTIAAINGICMGGGLDLALACKVRVAARSAVFAHPGSRLGIITGWGGTQRLPRLIGKSNALELFCTGGRISSEEALRVGLITQIADPVLEAAMGLANHSVATS